MLFIIVYNHYKATAIKSISILCGAETKHFREMNKKNEHNFESCLKKSKFLKVAPRYKSIRNIKKNDQILNKE